MADQDSNNQVITIDSEISKILGLEDNFDLDPDEYLQLIREKLVQYDFLSASKKITPEQEGEQRLLASQVRAIREQKRIGDVKFTTGNVKNKINADSFFNRKPEETKEPEKRIVDPSRLLSGSTKTGDIIKYKSQKVEELKDEKPKVEELKEENPEEDDGESKKLIAISNILDSILSIFKNQFKFDQKKTEEQRRDKETKKREKRESGLEKGFAMVTGAVKKMLAPLQNIFEQIWKYFFFTFLGKMFTDLMKWLEDPKNKGKIEVLGRFLKDWWPLLLGAYIAFATPFGFLVRGAIKMVLGLTGKILGLLPKLLRLSKGLITSAPVKAAARMAANVVTSPTFLFPAAVAGMSVLANEVTGQRKAAKVQTENKARSQTGKGLGVQGTDTMTDKVPTVGNMGATTPYGLLQGASSGGLVRKPSIGTYRVIRGVQGASSGGLVRKPSIGTYSNGAQVTVDGYSGIDNNTGVSITGAGKDTQLIAARPGEVVLTPEDANKIQNTTGFDVYNFVKDRKPSYTNFDKIKMFGQVPLANAGGIIGFKDGGIVGSRGAAGVGGLGGVGSRGAAGVGGLGGVGSRGAAGVGTPVLKLGARISGDPDHKYDSTLTKSIPILYRMLQTGRFNERGWGNKKFLNYLTSRLLIESSNFSRSKEMYDSNPNDPPGKPGYTYFSGYSGMNGNKNSDDAYNFRGRGAIQLTGRSHYDKFNNWLRSNGHKGYDVVRNPDLLSTNPKIQALSSIYYLEDREKTFGINFADIARRGDSKAFTYNINGGYNHLSETQSNLRQIEGLPGGVNYGTGFSPQQKRSLTEKSNPIGNILNSVMGLFRPPSAEAASTNQIPTKKSKRLGMDPRRLFGMQGGGSLSPITTRTGIDIPGGMAGADTQYLPQYNTAVQPGEEIFKYVIPKDAAQKGMGSRLMQLTNQMVANYDSNSTAAKIGFRNREIGIRPPLNRSNGGGNMVLPPITTSSSGGLKGSPVANSQDLYAFSPVLETAIDVRKMHVDMYGILD